MSSRISPARPCPDRLTIAAVLCIGSLAWLAVVVGFAAPPSAPAAPPPAAAKVQPARAVPAPEDVRRYQELITTLASEKMEGRGAGSPTIEQARDYIAQQFAKAGLQPAVRPLDKAGRPGAVAYLEALDIPVGITVKEAHFAAIDKAGKERQFVRDRDFAVLGFSSQAAMRGNPMFVGYGVRNKQHQYDSYSSNGKPLAKDSLKGKAAVCWRYEPMTAAGKSAWDANGSWKASQLSAKASLAAEHGAAALVVVSPPTHAQEGLPAARDAAPPSTPIPVIQITPAVFKTLWGQADRPTDDASLQQLQKDADAGKGQSQELPGVTLSVRVKVEPRQVTIHNVAAVLPGSGGLAQQYIVIGAHYDGLGSSGSGAEKRVCFGADDNASGTAAVVLLAERWAKYVRGLNGQKQDRRSLLFVAFAGEERGLLGSRYLSEHLGDLGIKPEQIDAMINFDMIGRLRDDRTTVFGVDTADRWNALLDTASRGDSLAMQRNGSGFGPSDHASFSRIKVPVLFFHSGVHGDIHSPRDSLDKINCEGAVRIANLADAVLRQRGTDPVRMAYLAPKPGQEMPGRRPPSDAFLGIMPEPAAAGAKGVKIASVLPNSPASAVGLLGGDHIVQLGEAKIASVDDLLSQLAKRKGGDKVSLTIQRADRTIHVDAVLKKR